MKTLKRKSVTFQLIVAFSNVLVEKIAAGNESLLYIAFEL